MDTEEIRALLRRIAALERRLLRERSAEKYHAILKEQCEIYRSLNAALEDRLDKTFSE